VKEVRDFVFSADKSKARRKEALVQSFSPKEPRDIVVTANLLCQGIRAHEIDKWLSRFAVVNTGGDSSSTIGSIV
jgi:hypothetical protein